MANSPFDLTGRTALVTGASSGLGRHFAEVLARAGARVALVARRTDALEQVRQAIVAANPGIEMPVIQTMDVTNPQAVNDAIDSAWGALGRIDILVNNAGVTATTPFLDMDEDSWNGIIDTNLTGCARVARAVGRRMRDDGKGGAIINVASILGLRVAGQVSAYTASKAGLVQLTKAMALELARNNIRVNALCPGYVETDLNRDFFESEAGKTLIKRVPQRRLGRMAELDGPLLLLASDAGSYMTGAALCVDGGHLVSSL